MLSNGKKLNIKVSMYIPHNSFSTLFNKNEIKKIAFYKQTFAASESSYYNNNLTILFSHKGCYKD